MSRNEKRIREALRIVGYKRWEKVEIVWEPISRGCEMEGPYGGWILDGFDPIGYSTDEAVEAIKSRRFIRMARP